MSIKALAAARYAIVRTANYYGVTVPQIIGVGRRRAVVEARAVAAWCARQHGLSFPELGRLFGHRHHTTMLHHVRRGADLVKGLG